MSLTGAVRRQGPGVYSESITVTGELGSPCKARCSGCFRVEEYYLTRVSFFKLSVPGMPVTLGDPIITGVLARLAIT